MKQKTTNKIDPTSDLYRICKNDQVEFMANHRNQIFCDEKCADDFHNRKKREAAEKKLMEEVNKALEAPIPIPVPETPLPIAVKSPDDNLMKNVKILDTLEIDPEKGTHYNMDWLYSIGYDFKANTGKGKLYNIDQSLNCHFIQIGNYRLYRVEFSHVLIKKIN
jgi:hypothetical protein